jgi:hypothetical protein
MVTLIHSGSTPELPEDHEEVNRSRGNQPFVCAVPYLLDPSAIDHLAKSKNDYFMDQKLCRYSYSSATADKSSRL